MIKFFRKIRQNLVSEGKTGKYLKYAIGEIILVVIGIVIALQLDNLNTDRKQKAYFNQILKQVVFELNEEINRANIVIDFYITKDSLANQFFQKTLPFGVFDKEKDLMQLTVMMSGRRALFRQEALTKFVEESNQTDSIYIKLVTEMKTLIINKDGILSHYDVMNYWWRKHDENRIFNTEWYYDFKLRNLTDEVVDYYMNDPVYRNILRIFKNKMINNYNSSIINYRHNARLLIDDISKILGEDAPHITGYVTANDRLKESLGGKYRLTSVSDTTDIQIYQKEAQWHYRDLRRSNRRLMFFTNDSTFYTDASTEFNILPDGTIFSRGGRTHGHDPSILVKIED